MSSRSHLIRMLVVAVLWGGVAVPASAQPHDQHDHLTPTARRLNESFADPDVQQWIARFESEGRAIYDSRFDILDLMALKPGVDVADIGAGSGFLSRLMAQRVGPGGTVYAVDIAPSMVEHIDETAKAMELDNVTALLGDPRSPRLAESSVDVVFIADSYHHFEFPMEMLAEIKKALRPDGLFLLIDYERVEGQSADFVLNMVRAGKDTFTREIVEAGFELVEEVDMLEEQYVLKFRSR
ncbi:MAG: class I SAM-dependent methyltransferase [bacterium]